MTPIDESSPAILDADARRIVRAATHVVLNDLDVSANDVVNAKARLDFVLDHERLAGHHPWARMFSSPRIVGSVVAGIVVAAALVIAGWRVGVTHVENISSTAMLTYATGNGERASVTLPDGSHIMLNVASRLDVPADYVRGNRHLRLTGSAIFVVAHQSANPFTVQAGPSMTRVLGTTFMVRYYPTDVSANVVVREGKVAVQASIVPALRHAEVSHDGVVTVRPASAPQLSFANGILIVEDKQLPDAILDLNRWYDADIRLGDTALASRGVGGTFAAGSLDDLAEFLEFTLKVRVVRDGRVLTLFSR